MNLTEIFLSAVIIAAAILYHAETGRHEVVALPSAALLLDTRTGDIKTCRSTRNDDGQSVVVCDKLPSE